LNAVFGTDFKTMNDEEESKQETKGIWIAKNEELKTLVLDVEGSDSSERGNNREVRVFY
jgi:dsDNA-binding SOS-regulon protein